MSDTNQAVFQIQKVQLPYTYESTSVSICTVSVKVLVEIAISIFSKGVFSRAKVFIVVSGARLDFRGPQVYF
ncbi:hypothetical protein ES708_29433 [subsurface metagenome]